MPLYRVISSGRRSAIPSSTWMCKATDEAAIAAARELLGRGGYAEVWGENELVACLEPEGRADAAPVAARSAVRMPMMRYVAAGFATTAGIALIFAAMQARGLPPAAGEAQTAETWALLDTAATGMPAASAATNPPSTSGREAGAQGTTRLGAGGFPADPAAVPTTDSLLAALPDAPSVTAAVDGEEVQAMLAAATPDAGEAIPADVPAATHAAAHHVRHRPAARHWTSHAVQGQVFASGERSTVDVYGMFGRGFVQGGN